VGRAGLNGLVLLLGLWGCGYGLERKTTSLPREIRTIAIPTMDNQTLEAGIENAFTHAMVRRFNLEGRLRVVREDRADSILEGSIQDFSITSISYGADGLAVQYRTEVSLGVIVRRVDTGEILWEAPSLKEIQEFRVTSNLLTNEARKQEAIDGIARQLAEVVYDRLVNRF